VPQNIYLVQGMEHTDERGVILLTAPKNIEDGDASVTRIAEGFSLLQLINDS
jgi:hypothetical protein